MAETTTMTDLCVCGHELGYHGANGACLHGYNAGLNWATRGRFGNPECDCTDFCPVPASSHPAPGGAATP